MSNKVPITAMPEFYTDELKNFLGVLGKVTRKINLLEMMTPVNAHEEKAKWLRAATAEQWTTPQFRYDRELLRKVVRSKRDLELLLEMMPRALKSLSHDEQGYALREMAEARYQETVLMTRVAQTMLDGDYMRTGMFLKEIYGVPSQKIVDEARDYAECLKRGEGHDQEDSPEQKLLREQLKELRFNAEEIRENFAWLARQCGLEGTRPIEVDPTVTAITVRSQSSKGAAVLIPEDCRKDGTELVQLAGHEILCHWGDAERTKKALPLLGRSPDDILYEGHATWSDYRVRLMLGEKAQQQQLPYYIIAMNLAKQGMTFAELARLIFDMVKQTEMSDEVALKRTWTTCFRVFRGSAGGLDNGTDRFAMTKDRAYFEGRQLAERLHREQRGSILEISSISIHDLEVLSSAVEFGPATIVPPEEDPVLRDFIQHLLS